MYDPELALMNINAYINVLNLYPIAYINLYVFQVK